VVEVFPPDQSVFVFFETLSFPKSGVYHAVVEPFDPAAWKAVNVDQVQLASEEVRS